MIRNIFIRLRIFIILFLLQFFLLSVVLAQHEQPDSVLDDPSALFQDHRGLEMLSELPFAVKNKSFPKNIELNERRLQVAESKGNKKGIAAIANNLGVSWIRTGEFAKAIEYLIKSLEARKEMNDKKGMAITTGIIGFDYQQMKDYDKALQYYYNSYEISKELNLTRVNADISGFMGMVYMQKKDTVHAGTYFREALAGLHENADKRSKAILLNRMGESYLEINDYIHSQDYFNRSFALMQELDDKKGAALELRNSGIVFFKKGDYNKALDYFNRSLKFSDQLIVKKLIKDTFLKLAAVYSFQNDFANADKYHGLYRDLKDSISRFEKSKNISNDDMQQEMVEKEKVIDLLSRENQEQSKVLNQQGLELSNQLTETEIERQSKERALEELNLAMIEKKEKEKQFLLLSNEKAERELELSKKEVELHKKSELMNALIGGILLILTFSFFTYNRYRYKRKSHDALNQSNIELTQTLDKLKSTQTQLVYSQKMASLGQLTAGIAHEIQNPLNFVNNFSELSVDLLNELQKAASDEEKKEIAESLKENLIKISHHGKRADNIVKSMLQHSRTGTHEKQETDINKLADEFTHLAYHGLRATDMNFNCEIHKHFDLDLPKANVVPQDISRVLLNILNNAFYAVKEKSKTADKEYEPKVGITTNHQNGNVIIKIMDNGNGIPDEVKDKIFNPFFSTKPTGEGTGIGLSLSYDIVVQGHGGEIKVESKKDEGTTFIISLPLESKIEASEI